MTMMSVSSTTLVVAVQQVQEGDESTKIAEEVNSLAGEYTLESTSQLSCKQSEEHVYRQEGGPWVLYWDEKQAGWWFAEEKNYNLTGLFWAAGEKEKVPETGWQWRGIFGLMYHEIPLSISWKQVLEVVEEITEPDAEMLENSSGDVLTNIRDMSMKHWQDLKAATSEKSAAAHHCFIGCFDFLTHPDNLAKVKEAVQTYVPSLGQSGEKPGEEQHFELMPSVATWHGPPQLKKIADTDEQSEKSLDPQAEVAADLLRAKEEFIDFFASRAKPDGQRSVLIEQTLRRNVAKQALEANNGLRCLQLEAQATSAAESHAQEVLRLRAELRQKEDAAGTNEKLQEAVRAAEEAQANAEKQAFRCERLEAALREEEQKALTAAQSATDSDGNAGKVEELAASLKDQARAVLEMKEYADQQVQICAEQTQKCTETQALLEEKSAHLEELASLTRQAQVEAADSNKRCAELEVLLQQAAAHGSGQEELPNLQADVAKLENENANLRRKADAAVAEAESTIDSHAKRCAELEALLQEAVAVGGTQEEEVKRVRDEADAAVAEARTVVDSYAKRCAELEALLQDAPAAGSAEEVNRVRDEADAAIAEAQTVVDSYAKRCAELEALLQEAPAAGGAEEEVKRVKDEADAAVAEAQAVIDSYAKRCAELEALLQEAPAAGGSQEDVKRVRDEAEAALADAQTVIDSYANRCAEMEALLQEAPAAGGTQDEVQALRAQLANLEGEYSDFVRRADEEVFDLRAQLQGRKASAGGSEAAGLENVKAQMADRIQELEAALETQDMQRIQSIEAEVQGQYLSRIKELEGAVQELDSQAASAKQNFKAELDAVNCQWADQMASSQASLAQLLTEKGELETEINRLREALVKAESAHPSQTPGVPVAAGTTSPKMPVATTGVVKAGGSLFNTLDANNDGGISREEFNRAVAAGAIGGARPATFKTSAVAKAPASSVRATRTVAGPVLRTSANPLPGHLVSRTVTPASQVVPRGVPMR